MCRPDGQNSRCYVDAATTSCRSLEVLARCGASTSGTSEKESFPNPQRFASVVLLKGRAMDENNAMVGTKRKDDFVPYWQDEKDCLCIVEFSPTDNPEARLFSADIIG